MKTYNWTQYKPIDKVTGNCSCEICGEVGNLVLRKGKQFRLWVCECPNGHRPIIKEEVDDIFQIGDRIRIYHEPFGGPIDYKSYDEGVVIKKELSVINYQLEMKVDKAFLGGKPLQKTSWLYGHIIRGISSDCDSLELLTPQMRIIF